MARGAPTLEEFLSGAPLTYRGADMHRHEATFVEGQGLKIERKGELVGFAESVSDRASARRFYHNETRRPQRDERPAVQVVRKKGGRR